MHTDNCSMANTLLVSILYESLHPVLVLVHVKDQCAEDEG
jgi:hypothetical protein